MSASGSLCNTTNNVCNDTSVCTACCHNYISNGAACDLCIAQTCPKPGSPVLGLVSALGLLWLIVGIAFLLMWQDNTTLAKMQKGMSVIVIMSLPCVLFEAMFTINLRSVKWSIIASITGAKFLMWLVGASTGLISSGGDVGVAGLYALFLTLGNDLAFGLPLFSNIFPQFVAYDLILCNISELVFNPMCYFLFEYAHQQKKEQKQQRQLEQDGAATTGSGSCSAGASGGGSTGTKFGKILLNVFAEPMVIFALLGLFFNGIINIGLGHCPPEKEKCEMPAFMTDVYDTIGKAFNLVALLSFGLHLYGKGHALVGRQAIMPFSLTALRVVLAPTLTMLMLQALRHDGEIDVESFAFLYVLIPAGPGCVVMAIHYSLPVTETAAAMLMSTLVSAPIMFLGIAIISLNDNPAELKAVMDITQTYLGWISLGAATLLLLFFVLLQRWGSPTWARIMGLPRYSPWLWRFPRPQVTLLALALWLFFVFRPISTTANLDPVYGQTMGFADFVCIMAGLARSLLSPVICYHLQSWADIPLAARRHRRDWRVYGGVWVLAAVGAVLAVGLQDVASGGQQTATSTVASFVYVKIAFDVAGLTLMAWSLASLARKLQREEEKTPLQRAMSLTRRQKELMPMHSFRYSFGSDGGSFTTIGRGGGFDEYGGGNGGESSSHNSDCDRSTVIGKEDRSELSNDKLQALLDADFLDSINQGGTTDEQTSTAPNTSTKSLPAATAVMHKNTSVGWTQTREDAAPMSTEAEPEGWGGGDDNKGKDVHGQGGEQGSSAADEKDSDGQRMAKILPNSTYVRLCLVFLYYALYTVVNLTYHVYVGALHHDYIGAAKTLVFLRTFLGNSTGILLFLCFGYDHHLKSRMSAHLLTQGMTWCVFGFKHLLSDRFDSNPLGTPGTGVRTGSHTRTHRITSMDSDLGTDSSFGLATERIAGVDKSGDGARDHRSHSLPLGHLLHEAGTSISVTGSNGVQVRQQSRQQAQLSYNLFNDYDNLAARAQELGLHLRDFDALRRGNRHGTISGENTSVRSRTHPSRVQSPNIVPLCQLFAPPGHDDLETPGSVSHS